MSHQCYQKKNNCEVQLSKLLAGLSAACKSLQHYRCSRWQSMPAARTAAGGMLHFIHAARLIIICMLIRQHQMACSRNNTWQANDAHGVCSMRRRQPSSSAIFQSPVDLIIAKRFAAKLLRLGIFNHSSSTCPPCRRG